MISTQGIIPATKDIILYRGSAFDFVISVMDDEEGVDLSLMDNIRWRFFSSNSEDEPFIDMDITETSRLTIENVNQFSGRITSEETIGANIRSLNHEIIFTVSGEDYIYVSGEVTTLKSPGNRKSFTGGLLIEVLTGERLIKVSEVPI